MGIAQEVEAAIDGLLDTAVSSKSAALCAALAPIALTGATIHLIVIAFTIMRGDAGDPVQTVVWKSFRMALIAGIALSAGAYQTNVLEGTAALESALIESMSGLSSVGALIDDFAKPFDELGVQLWNQAVVGFWPNFGLMAAAAAVAIAECFIFSLGLGFYLLAKVALAIVLAIGPAFVLCAMWPATEKYTESWIGQVLNCVVLKVLVATSIVMLTSFVSQYAAHISATPDTANVISATTSLLLCCGALGVVMFNLPQIAAALSGGVSIAGIGRTVGRALLDLMNRPAKAKPAPPGKPAGGAIFPGGGNSTAGPPPPPRAPLFQRNTIERLRKAA
ncbi:type IV secretion system protein [Massilia sp. R2A-15]|uniref:type IV secretion system protein n=1 Tax=Massilia sp. R2A-15 TaxID=3064278 RepID=UPI002734A2E8|nr:type IV secretion system protein [Massilia sp. R2A-15]WLI91081.1 type IV secretion system protein [Massilia sp. R2A-15]